MKKNFFKYIALATIIPFSFFACSDSDDHHDNPTSACDELGIAKNSKIINGVECNATKSSIGLINLGDGTCTGTVISENTMISAAHCFEGYPTSGVVVVGGKQYNIKEYHSHPKYDRYSSPIPGTKYENYDAYDVAVVIIKGTFDIAPMPIITSRAPSKGESLIVAGYGLDENDASGVLKATYMTVSQTVEEGFVLPYYETNTNVCYGDSGGPAFGYANGKLGIFGVTSSGLNDTCLDGDETFFPSLKYNENLDFILRYSNPSQI